MSATTAIWLGVVQGLTEFLPVSSSGHLVIAQHFMSDFEQPGLTFDVVLHLGTLGAVLLYLRSEVGTVFSGLKPGSLGAPGRRLIGLLVLGTIPVVVVALLFKNAIEASFENLSLWGSLWHYRHLAFGDVPIRERRAYFRQSRDQRRTRRRPLSECGGSFPASLAPA